MPERRRNSEGGRSIFVGLAAKWERGGIRDNYRKRSPSNMKEDKEKVEHPEVSLTTGASK